MKENVEVRVDSTDAVLKVFVIAVYAGLIGYVVGRSLLRSEQARARELSALHQAVWGLHEEVHKLKQPEPESEPEPDKPAKK